MKTVFSDLSLEIDLDNREALKQLAPTVEDTFVIHSILTGLAGREDIASYRQVVCQLVPKCVDPVVLVHCVTRGMLDGLANDLEMFNALDNRVAAFSNTPSCLALICSHFIDLPGSEEPTSYAGRIIDHCLQAMPEGLVYELAVKQDLPNGRSFFLLVPYLNAAHRAQLLTEVKDMEKAWWLIRNFTGLTNLMLVKDAIKDRRVRAAVDAYIHGNTLEE
jgi:hypothetical protein